MSAEKLAINGGPRTVKSDRPLRMLEWKKGVQRSFDLLRMLEATIRGKTAIANSTGMVGKFERAFRDFTGAKLALPTNNGTSTLHSAYVAVGVGPGTEVIVPSYTWHASATPVLMCGAVPVFCEIDPRTLTIDPDDIARRITKRTRAICVLHPWGNPAPMDRILEVAGAHGVDVIEDCSHAHGATYKGKAVGTWGRVGCYSLQGSKAVDGGEAGVAITDDPVLYDRMLLLGHNFLVGNGGQKADSFPGFGDVSLGVKFRPALASMYFAYSSLMRLKKRNEHCRRLWQVILEEFKGVPGIRPIDTLPGAVRGGFYAFPMEYTGMDFGGLDTEAFVKAVRAEGSPLELDQFRHQLLHTTPMFTTFDRRTIGGGCYDATRPWEENLWKGALPVTERITARMVRFPKNFYGIPEAYLRQNIAAVKKVLAATIPAAAKRNVTPLSPRGDNTRVAASGGR